MRLCVFVAVTCLFVPCAFCLFHALVFASVVDLCPNVFSSIFYLQICSYPFLFYLRQKSITFLCCRFA